MRMLERQPKRLGSTWHKHQVDVVWHQVVPHHRHIVQTDLSVMKVFPLERLHKGASIEFRLEASNAFNHPTFGQPATDVDDPLFGQITYTSSAPRQGQFGLKVTF